MKRFSKVLVFVLAAAMLAVSSLALTACGDNMEKTKLTVFTMFGGDDGHGPAYRNATTKFTAVQQYYTTKDSEGNAVPNPIKVEIEDKSVAAGNDFEDIVKGMFASDATTPDVLYIFSPNRNKDLRDQGKLATVAEIRAKFPQYGRGIAEHSLDPTCLPFKGITEGIQYNKEKVPASVLVSYGALRKFLTEDRPDDFKIVQAEGEINYWFNYIALEKVGDPFAQASVADKAFFTANEAAIKEAIRETLEYGAAMGFNKNASTTDYGKEKEAMWGGDRDFDMNGSWNTAGFYPPYNDGSYAEKIGVMAPPTTDNKYVLAGFTHGWMISKNCFNDAKKLELAVKFINEQIDNIPNYAETTGGVYANGWADNTKPMNQGFAAIANMEGKTAVIPIDDRFNNDGAKNALFMGMKAGFEKGDALNPAAEATAIFNKIIEAFNATA